jgi:hypothetical protein
MRRIEVLFKIINMFKGLEAVPVPEVPLDALERLHHGLSQRILLLALPDGFL